MLLISFDVLAQASIRFTRLVQKHEMSQASTNTLLQDHQGFMWIGSQDGLNRYDGYGFKIYRHKPDDPTTISSGWIKGLYEDKAGILWVTTFAGLNRFDKKTEQFTRYNFDADDDNSISHDNTTVVTEDHLGMLWIGTRSGLNSFDRASGTFTRYYYDPNDPQSISNDQILAITEDKRGRLWVGTRNGGLNLFDRQKQTFSRYQPDAQNLNTDHITSLITDQNGHLWLGTYDQGLIRLDLEAGTFEHYQHDPNDNNTLTNNRIISLLQDSQGSVWVGTDRGLNRYHEQQNNFLRLQHDPTVADSLAGHRVLALYEDNTGVIWVGMSGDLSLFDRTTEDFGHYRRLGLDANSLSDNTIWSAIKDDAGILWIGTDVGLNRFDRVNNRFIHYKDLPGISNNRVLTVYQNRRGEHWIGTFSDGVQLLNDEAQEFTYYQHDPDNPGSLSNDRVDALIEDSHQQMWFGTNKGLNRYDRKNKVFKRYYHDPSDPNSLSSDQIITLFVDSADTLWIGTRYGGLNRYNDDTDTFTHYRNTEDPQSISHNRVYSITEDQEKNLWIGTKAGLNRMVPGQESFTRFFEKEGLLNDTVYAVLVDNQGYLWLSSNKGLSRFDIKSQSFRHFRVEDGLQSNEFNNSVGFKSVDGELFFGGPNGFNAFYPENITAQAHAPDIVVTDLLLFNQSVALQSAQPESPLSEAIHQTSEFTLTHNDSVFAFEFAAIDFAHPQGSQYAYRLFGYDKKWLYTDAKNRRATYTNLSAGRYTFKAKAANKEGLWGEATAGIDVIILPAPWRSWWAYTLYSLTLLSIVGLIVYMRVQKLQERERHHLITEQNKERLQLALWGSGDQLWDVDVSTNRIKRKNLLPQVSYPTNSHWGMPWQDDGFFHPDDKTNIEQQILAHFRRESKFCEITYRARGKAGGWIWLLDRGKVVEWDERGKPLRFSGTTRNVQQLKSTEEELLALTQSLEQRVELRTQELSQSNEYLKETQSQLVESEKMALLGGLVAGVSHEINTPVGIAITALSCLKDRTRSLFDMLAKGKMTRSDFDHFGEDSDESLALALESLYRASDLVENFKQIAVDRTHERLCEVQLNQLIKDVVDASMLDVVVSLDGIVVSCPLNLTFETYPDAFHKIFFQLIQNTLVHGYLPGEKVEIKIDVSHENNTIIIFYQDKGRGMDQQTLDHIFDPFYTTNRTDGTGLGMHVVYNQVSQLLKGKISCQSEPGKGCQFVIQLPV